MENKNIVTENILETGAVLIKAVAAQIADREYSFPSETDFEKLYKLAYSHRIAAVIAPLVLNCDFASADIKAKFKKELFRTAARYDAQTAETEKISSAFSQNNIKHCFLKGVKICAFHNQPETRFMLDIDVYVENLKLGEAEKILLENGYQKVTFTDDKDTGYTKKPFLNIELHKELKYDYDKGYEYYKGAFSRMVSENGFELNMKNEDFYVYILSHTAHHFEVSGTGIKNIIDHYYLSKKLKPLCNEGILKSNLDAIGLTEFSKNADMLCQYWFEGAEPSEDIKQMADYVILSGVFGNETNQYFSGIIRGEYDNKKSSYFWARLFPPVRALKAKYPILKKAPFLLPLFWVIRIITAVFSAGRIKDETKAISTVENNGFENHKQFLKNMGL